MRAQFLLCPMQLYDTAYRNRTTGPGLALAKIMLRFARTAVKLTKIAAGCWDHCRFD